MNNKKLSKETRALIEKIIKVTLAVLMVVGVVNYVPTGKASAEGDTTTETTTPPESPAADNSITVEEPAAEVPAAEVVAEPAATEEVVTDTPAEQPVAEAPAEEVKPEAVITPTAEATPDATATAEATGGDQAEASQPAVTETTEPTEKAVAMPSFHAEQNFNGTTVSVDVPEGALPEGTTTQFTQVNAQDYAAAVSATEGKQLDLSGSCKSSVGE